MGVRESDPSVVRLTQHEWYPTGLWTKLFEWTIRVLLLQHGQALAQGAPIHLLCLYYQFGLFDAAQESSS